jgi:excisionase family DNA binding protein
MAPEHTAERDDEEHESDPLSGPFCRVDDLADLGFGDRHALYEAVRRGEIPSVRLGRKVLIPTAWAKKAMAG